MAKKKVETKIKRRIIEGIVVSNKMQGTVKVRVETTTSHPVYKKVIYYREFFFAHTDKQLNEGDKVRIKESRPYSKNVRWVVV
jgi:small subunit ribosomal protein S17